MEFNFVWCFVGVVLSVRCSGGQNIDQTMAVFKTGDPGSFFGLSVSLHRKLNPEENLLLVGAPKGNDLLNPTLNDTGCLFSCAISTDQSDCKLVKNIDQSSEVKKKNQWLGVSVASQGPGKMVMVCAHRHKSKNSRMDGSCYILEQDLSLYKNVYSFCKDSKRDEIFDGLCQFGISVASIDGSEGFSVGHPGIMKWTGMLTMYTTTDGIVSDYDGEILNAEDSYQGFSVVASTGVFSKHTVTVVAGAPRYNHSGAVMLWRPQAKDGTLVYISQLNSSDLASSFGYAVALLDLNADGWQDLVVGAPNLFRSKELQGGAIFIYMNEKGRLSRNSLLRTAPGGKLSQFGLALEHIGDINLDGYQDLAVGAPCDDRGKVYIFLGNQDSISQKPSQVLGGQELPLYFGFSLSGGLDVDGNGFPDLLVGSLSDKVVLLRTSPLVSITSSIISSEDLIDLTVKNCLARPCVNITMCFKYSCKSEHFNSMLKLDLNLTANVQSPTWIHPKYLTFQTSVDHAPVAVFKHLVKLPRKGEEECVTTIAQITEKVDNLLKPLIFHGIYVVHEDEPSTERGAARTLTAPHPILEDALNNHFSLQVGFLILGCKDNRTCHSNLQLNTTFYLGNENSGFVQLPRDTTGCQELHISDKKVVLQMVLTNSGDKAYNAQLVTKLPSELAFKSFHVQPEMNCDYNEDSSHFRCVLGKPFENGAQANINVTLMQNTAFPTPGVDKTNLSVQVTTDSDQEDVTVTKCFLLHYSLRVTLEGSVEPPYLSFGGSKGQEGDTIDEEDVGNFIKYTIKWQGVEATQGMLDYHRDLNQMGLLSTHKNSSPILQTEEPLSTQSDGRKISKLMSKEEYSGTGVKEMNMECPSGHVLCATAICQVDITMKTRITLHARLWNSTFVQDFADYDRVQLVMSVKAYTHSQSRITILDSGGAKIRLWANPDPTILQTFELPWWIILIAVLAGVIILALLIFMMYKCHFFKRSHYYEQMQRATHIPEDQREATRAAEQAEELDCLQPKVSQ
uniref:Integrin alpha-2 domain-containing protein n=1 Tax=Eptatretus burgeri TaxID=7764 RepID=A0A8C4WU62_EPTBU